MVRIGMLAAAWLLAACSAANGQEIAPYLGARTVVAPDGSLRFGWPGSYFEGRFRGTEVTVGVDSAQDHFRIFIDGKPVAELVKPGRILKRFDGLAPGEHVVRLEMVTENQSGESRFLGFTTSGTPLTVTPRKREIEIIGDSHSAGYGNTATKRQCSGAEIHDTTDTQQAWGPVLARGLNADYRIFAWSGYGIVRNYNGGSAGQSLPVIYPRAIPSREGGAAPDGWAPQLIVINLGTNDFSTKLNPGERWHDEASLKADYRSRYGSFLDDLHKRYPRARFVLMGAENFIGEVEAVASAAKGRGLDVTALKIPALELTACDWHPSLKDNQIMADLVQRPVERMSGLWD